MGLSQGLRVKPRHCFEEVSRPFRASDRRQALRACKARAIVEGGDTGRRGRNPCMARPYRPFSPRPERTRSGGYSRSPAGRQGRGWGGGQTCHHLRRHPRACPRTHVFAALRFQGVGGRDKPGHDVRGCHPRRAQQRKSAAAKGVRLSPARGALAVCEPVTCTSATTAPSAGFLNQALHSRALFPDGLRSGSKKWRLRLSGLERT